METTFLFPVLLAVVVLVCLAIFFHFVPFFLWLNAKVSGVHISLIQLFFHSAHSIHRKLDTRIPAFVVLSNTVRLALSLLRSSSTLCRPTRPTESSPSARTFVTNSPSSPASSRFTSVSASFSTNSD